MKNDRKKKTSGGREPEKKEDLLYGKHAVHALKEAPHCVRRFYIQEEKTSREADLLAFAKSKNIPCTVLSREKMEEFMGDVKHQGMGADMYPVPTRSFEEWVQKLGTPQEPALVVVLDHIQDPQNMGAIIRTAEVAGARGVLFPERRSVVPGASVVRASSGAALRVPLIKTVNVSRSLQELQEAGFWTVGLEPASENLLWKHTTFPRRLALVLGSEGKGMSRLVAERCDELIALPMLGTTGSLNVSAAAAVGIFEWVRSMQSGEKA